MRIFKTVIPVLQIIIFLIFLFFSCQDNKRLPGAEIIFDKQSHDFGEVKQGVVVSHVFNFENIGADTLEIGRVRSS